VKRTEYDIQTVSRNFEIPGSFVSAESYGHGHINDTYAATFDMGGRTKRYILQRINHDIFKDAVSVMDNIVRVTAHQRRKLDEADCADPERHALTLILGRDGLSFYRDDNGDTWRTYLFIEGARTYEFIKDPSLAFQAARAFGKFQDQLADLPGEKLRETIPDFHHTPRRFEALEHAIEADTVNLAKAARPEIDFALKHKHETATLLEKHAKGLIPERVTHNDTKLNNVMLDTESNKGICVIDLDTVMPGLIPYDFGDMVRTATSFAAEDEKDLSKVSMQMNMFEALVNGYLESAGTFLNETEKAYLAFSGKLITFEIGVRFLTDFLSGDVYFKVSRPSHNLDRCRTQFKLVESMISQEDAMNEFVASWPSRAHVGK